MRKLLTAGLAVWVMSFAVQAGDINSAPAVSKTAISKCSGTKKAQVAERLAAEMQQLFNLLKRHNKLFKPDPVMRRRYDILNMVAKEVSPLLEVSETPFVNNEKRNEPEARAFPVLPFAKSSILYVRIDGITDSTAEKLENVRSCNKADACILDLRKCGSGNVGAMLNILDMFIKESTVVNLRHKQKLIFPMPKFVLIGPETSGIGELFAASLRKARDVMMIGEPTAGQPFVYKQFQLESGPYVNIPQLPECLKCIPQFPVKPEVLSSPQPQVAFKVLKTSGNFKKDPSISAAADIFKALQITRDI